MAIALVALAPTYPVFVVAWLLVGLASAGTFYPPAFAALTHWYGAGRVRAITTLTLVAGFASTIFAPLTAALGEWIGWRDTYLVLAMLLLVVTVPAHAFALRLPWHPDGGAGHGRPDREILTSRTFLLLTASGTLVSLAMYASLVNLVPLLLDHGVGLQLAAWALGLSGAGQVAGRLAYPVLHRRLTPNARAAGVIALMVVTLAALALVPGPAAGPHRDRGAGRRGPRPVHPGRSHHRQRPLGTAAVRRPQRRLPRTHGCRRRARARLRRRRRRDHRQLRRAVRRARAHRPGRRGARRECR